MKHFGKAYYPVPDSSQKDIHLRRKPRTNLIGLVAFFLILVPKVFSFFGAFDYSDYVVFALCLFGGMLAGFDAASKNTSPVWKNRSVGADAGRMVGLFALAEAFLLGFLMVSFIYLFSGMITFEPFEFDYGIGTFRATGTKDFILAFIVISVLIGLGNLVLA